MMRYAVTSREEILNASTRIVRQHGWNSVNIRSVAEACEVAVGSIYNYFDSKAELISATIETIWNDIFCRPEDPAVMTSIETMILWIYGRMEYGVRQYPGFFTSHSLAFFNLEKQEGKARMQESWLHVRQVLCAVLKADARVRADAFDETFTPEAFANILFSLILSSLMQEDYRTTAILSLIGKTIY